MTDLKKVLNLAEEMSISIMFNKVWEEYKSGVYTKKEILLAVEILLDNEENPRNEFEFTRQGRY